MDIKGFIRHVDDFLKNRIQQEFLAYKVATVKKNALDKKKEPGKGIHYSQGLLLVIECINEIEASLKTEPLQKEIILNSIEKLKKADKLMEAAFIFSSRKKSLLEDRASIPNKFEYKTKKMFLQEESEISSSEIKPDNKPEERKMFLPDQLSVPSREITFSDDKLLKIRERLGRLKSLNSKELSTPVKPSSSCSNDVEKGRDIQSKVSKKPDSFFKSGHFILSSKSVKEEKILPEDVNRGFHSEVLSEKEYHEINNSISSISDNQKDPRIYSDMYKNLGSFINSISKPKFKVNINKVLPEMKDNLELNLVSSQSESNKVKSISPVLIKSSVDEAGRKIKDISETAMSSPPAPTGATLSDNKEFIDRTTKDLVDINFFPVKNIETEILENNINTEEVPVLSDLISDKEKIEFSPSTSPGLMFSQADFISTSGSTFKISPNYYSPSRLKEPDMEYADDIPVDSPVYSLLIGYKDLKSYKIDFKSWVKKQSEVQEELKYILSRADNIKENTTEKETLIDTINITISLMDELSLVCKDVEKDKNRRKIYEPLQVMYREDEEDAELKEIVDELVELNIEIYNISRKILPVDEVILEGSLTLEELVKQIPDEIYRTPLYIKIESTAMDVLKKIVPEDVFMKFLEEISQIITDSRDRYQSLEILDNEITLEVFRGSQMLAEAFDKWQKGVNLLKRFISTQNENDIHDGLSLIYEGTKKLVLIQNYYQQIDKQSQTQSFHRKFSL